MEPERTPSRQSNRAHLLSLALVAGSFAAAAVLYRRLPDPVPVHWDAHGQVNGFMPKPWGVLVLPLVTLGTYALLSILPRISPQGFRFDRFQGTYELIRTAILGFLFFATLLALLAGAGFDVSVARAVPFGVGVLFVVLGNVLGKVTKNFFVGIRTPWTLASDEVWLRTHRLGGRVFVVAGLVLAIAGLLGSGGAAPIVAVSLAAPLIPIVYSYVIYRRLQGPTGHAR
jgi:uncharacterized membrane protein